VEGMADMDAISEVSAESIKAFDVLAALLNELTEREQEVVRSLL
jgi:predicted DNA binding protein